MNGVKATNLSFSYGKQLVFEEISFEVGGGEILTLLGPNGSGKTTLLKCLNMLLKPQGSLFINSSDISRLNGREIAKFFGYVPQVHSPSFPYKAVDVVVSGRSPHVGFSPPTQEDYDLAYNVLDTLRLKHLAHKPYTQLSGGQLRLILIARALAQQPNVLLLDEPTSHLDFKNKFLVLNVLMQIASQGIAIIMSEHDPNLASIVSGIVLLICERKIAMYGKSQDVLTKDNLAKVYGIDVDIFERNGSRYIFPSQK